MPLSRTAIATRPHATPGSTRTWISPPAGVNLQAFVNRFVTTCVGRARSACSGTGASGSAMSSRWRAAWNSGRVVSSAPRRVVAGRALDLERDAQRCERVAQLVRERREELVLAAFAVARHRLGGLRDRDVEADRGHADRGIAVADRLDDHLERARLAVRDESELDALAGGLRDRAAAQLVEPTGIRAGERRRGTLRQLAPEQERPGVPQVAVLAGREQRRAAARPAPPRRHRSRRCAAAGHSGRGTPSRR